MTNSREPHEFPPGGRICHGKKPTPALRARSRIAVADALEPRTLWSQTINLPLVNPGFDTLYKPGSTSITASIPNESATQGFGQAYPVENLNGNLDFATVNYSDGSAGHTVDVPGWTVLPIERFPKQRPVAGIVKDSVAYPGKTDNFASIFYTPDISNDSTQIRQTLIGTTLLPNSEYILSADVDEGGALNLQAGSTFLSTSRVRSTAKDRAGFRRTTKTYVTHSTVPAGDITVVLGSGGSSDGDFDNVTLQLVSSGATPSPSPTPTPMPFGSFNGRNHNVKLTEPDGTIVTFAMSGGSGFATQDGNQIDLQISSASPKASVGITARLGSATFTLGNVAVSGSLNRLSAPAGTLSGAMSVSGAIGLLSLSSIGGQLSAGSIGRIQAGAVTGVVYSAGSIGSAEAERRQRHPRRRGGHWHCLGNQPHGCNGPQRREPRRRRGGAGLAIGRPVLRLGLHRRALSQRVGFRQHHRRRVGQPPRRHLRERKRYCRRHGSDHFHLHRRPCRPHHKV